MGPNALVIMSRVPSAGGKSRLAPILTPEQRELLQWAFLLDTLEKVEQAGLFDCYIAATPAGQIDFLKKQLINQSVKIIPQPAGNLGERMLAVSKYVFGLGYSSLIFLGTDAPALPPAYLTKAAGLLGHYSLVFGPALDGGYYLLGMQHPEGRIFEGIEWGSDKVLKKSLELCKKHDFTYTLLAPLADIDRPADLLASAHRVEQGKFGYGVQPLRTIKFINENILKKG